MRTAVNLMVLAVVLSGVGPLLVLASPVGPAATAFWRLFLGLPVALYLIRRSILLPPRAMFGVAVSAALLSTDLMLWNTAIFKTTILEASILVMVYPVIAAVASFLLFKERITRRLAAGGAIAFLGLCLMMTRPGNTGNAGSSLEGDLLAIGAAFCYAFSLLISSRLCRAYDTMIVSFWLMFFGAVTAAPVGLMEAHSVPQTPQGWGYILLYAAITLTGYILFNRGLKVVPTSLASLLGYAQPVVATLLGVVILDQVPSWSGIGGGIVIILGLVLATRPESPVAAGAEAARPAE